MQKHDLIETVKGNWALEKDGAAMYAHLAEKEKIPERKKIFQMLSQLEQKHADAWAAKLIELGEKLPAKHGETAHTSFKDEDLTMQEIILKIEEEERQDVATYLKQMREIDDEAMHTLLREVVLDEFAHAHVLSQMYAQSSDRSALDYIMRRQRQGTGSWIGDAIYGVNDGLGAIFGIVSGVSGATLGNSNIVLLAGLAGMIASALSMGSGAYLAAKSEREIFEAELIRERNDLSNNPGAAKKELSLFYQLKGVPEEDADKIVEYLAVNPDQFLRTMTAEKLNLTEDALSNPISSAITGSVSTAIGAFIPIIPFFFMNGIPAVIAAGVVSLIAHFAVGAAKSLVTVRSWWSSGLEMTIVGAVEGLVTYAIGIGLGHTGL
ncbi:MAG TPA: VIT1/CCC1 transporter family protein [Fimbriimonadaceae bacterium]|jgi:VIT1/CCC1 family predicted Fe2+/Mn2+ transporter/rubrerythrin